MTSDFIYTLETMAQERGIDRESMLQIVEEAILVAAKKTTIRSREMTVSIDRKTGVITCQSKLFVVSTITEPENQILLRDAKKKYPNAKVGDEIVWEVPPSELGRIAAQAAYQAIITKIRALERKNVCEQFKEMEHQLINGEVSKIDREGIIIRFDTAEGLLPRGERIPGEEFEPGDLVTALLQEVNMDKPGPALLVTRRSPEFVQRLFEREVTEISDGLVEIKAVSREAGFRSKIAVCSTESRIDPSGACIGQHGNRVKNIVRELGGEKVDVIEWNADPKVFITNALKPARLQSVELDEANKVAKVMVLKDQLSLAIGKKGQNVRLANLLTGWKIDINAQESEEMTAVQAFEESRRRAIETIGAVPDIGMEAAQVLVDNGYASLEGIIAPETEVADIAGLPGFDEMKAIQVIEAARSALTK